MLPVDHARGEVGRPAQDAGVSRAPIPAGFEGVDIGPKTIALYAEEIATAGDGDLERPGGLVRAAGVQHGHARASPRRWPRAAAVTVVGGGETAEAVEEFGFDDKMTHVSTGGGAFLAYVEGKKFQSLAQIDDK